MTTDSYQTVINSPETYKAIAGFLRTGAICIAWTDELGTQYDILFARGYTFGPVQGGIKWGNLFVSIMRVGAFAFDPFRTDTHPSYFGEKLGISKGETLDKLAELINGVRGELAK